MDESNQKTDLRETFDANLELLGRCPETDEVSRLKTKEKRREAS